MATKSSVARLIGEEWWLDKVMENGRRQYPKRIVVGHPINGRVYLPERTCHMGAPIDGEYKCSACGHLNRDTYRGDKGWFRPMYCAHCGAKVVGE